MHVLNLGDLGVSHPNFKLQGLDIVSLVRTGPQEGSAQYRARELFKGCVNKRVETFCRTPQEDEDFLFSVAIRVAATTEVSLFLMMCRRYLVSQDPEERREMRTAYWRMVQDFCF